MRKLIGEIFSKNDGYTLVETLVAMVLFVSVLIPLGVAIGTLLLDHEVGRRQSALLIGEREMTVAAAQVDCESAGQEAEGGFMVRRDVQQLEHTREILVTVIDRKKAGKILVKLHKTVLR